MTISPFDSATRLGPNGACSGVAMVKNGKSNMPSDNNRAKQFQTPDYQKHFTFLSCNEFDPNAGLTEGHLFR